LLELKDLANVTLVFAMFVLGYRKPTVRTGWSIPVTFDIIGDNIS